MRVETGETRDTCVSEPEDVFPGRAQTFERGVLLEGRRARRRDARGSLLRGGEGGFARGAGKSSESSRRGVRFSFLFGRGGWHQRLVRGSGSSLQQTSRFLQALTLGIVLPLPTFLRLGLALALVFLLLVAFALLPLAAR